MKVPKPQKMTSGNYFIRLRLSGENINITAATEKECVKKAMLVKAQYLADAPKKQTKTNMTVEQAIKKYIDERNKSVRPLSPATERGYLKDCDHCLSVVAKRPIAEINDWQDVINKLTKKYSPKTIKNAWGLVKSVLKFFELNIPPVILPQVNSKPYTYLKQNDLMTFVDYIATTQYGIGALLALHSLRRSELDALDWDNGDIDLKNGVIKIRRAAVLNKDNKLVIKNKTKTIGSTRTIRIMIPALLDLLKAEEDKTGRVLKMTSSALFRGIKKSCEKLGIEETTIHGLRHTFCSLAFSREVGMSEHEVMDIGGWSDPTTMRKIYKHIIAEDRLTAQNKMEAFYKSQDSSSAD